MNYHEEQEQLWGAGGIGGFLGAVARPRRRRARAPEAEELREAQAIVTHSLPTSRSFLLR